MRAWRTRPQNSYVPPSPRPEGVVTRGTTAPNRLRRADRWIISVCGPLLRRTDRPLVVDLGFGASPVTTAELFARLRAVHPVVEVVGVEIDPARVAAAVPYAREGLSFRRGGFELPVDRPPTLIRAFNVLRQYGEAEAWAAWDRLCAGLAPGGVLIEGTCGEIGRLATWVALSAGTAGEAAGDATPAVPWYGRPGGRPAWEPSSMANLRDAGGRGSSESPPGRARREAGTRRAPEDPSGSRDNAGHGGHHDGRAGHDRRRARASRDGRDLRVSREQRESGPRDMRGRGDSPEPRDPRGARRRDRRAVRAVPMTITFAAHLASLSRPSELAERLPKTLIHRNVPGEGVHEVFAAFDRAWAAAAPRSVFGPRQRWLAAVETLARTHPVLATPPYGGRVRWRLGEVTLPWSTVAPRT